MRGTDERTRRLRHFEERCRQEGLARTVQRRAIFEAIYTRRDHPTADRIYAAVKDRLTGVSRTTIYRVLETFVRAGIIIKVCHPGAAARYDPNTRRHHHLVCLRCDKVFDFQDARLDALPRPRLRGNGFQIDDYSISFRGICGACSPKLEKTEKKARGRLKPSTGQSPKRPRRA